MLVGHFSVAFVGKRITPKTSLGTLVLASMAFDLLWCLFMIAGIEHIRVKPGAVITSGVRLIDVLEGDFAYSHSLLTGAIWAALFSVVYFCLRRDQRGASVLFAAVLSHWLLDFISHPPDMPLAPGVDKYFGLGLWTSVPATILVEGLFWVAALIVYARAARPRSRAGVFVFWSVVAILTAAWINNIAGPPPPDLSRMGSVSLIFFSLTVAWAYWVDQKRGQVT